MSHPMILTLANQRAGFHSRVAPDALIGQSSADLLNQPQ